MNKEDNVLQRAFDVLTENHELKTVYINNNKIYKNINGEMQEINNMNKTYIANENHGFLKKGTKVYQDYRVFNFDPTGQEETYCRLHGDYVPPCQPDWYDEVFKEISGIDVEKELNTPKRTVDDVLESLSEEDKAIIKKALN